MPDRWKRLALWFLAVQLIVHIVAAVAIAQGQDGINALVTRELRYLEDRVATIERQDLPGRVLVLERVTTEAVWLGRGVAIAVLGQLVLAGFGLRKGK